MARHGPHCSVGQVASQGSFGGSLPGSFSGPLPPVRLVAAMPSVCALLLVVLVQGSHGGSRQARQLAYCSGDRPRVRAACSYTCNRFRGEWETDECQTHNREGSKPLLDFDSLATTGTGYGAEPASGYGAPDGGFGVVDDGGKDIYMQIGKLIPPFIAVFAAIILAQLLAPLMMGVLPMALNIKAPLVNTILSPLGLTLCAINPAAKPGASLDAPLVFPRSLGTPASRELHDAVGIFGYDISEDQIDIVSSVVSNAINTLSSG
jgi:hypothetical protein